MAVARRSIVPLLRVTPVPPARRPTRSEALVTRRVPALLIALLACLGALSVAAAPAQAAEVEVTYSPISLGDYCSARVSSSSTIGFYSGSLSCYRWGSGGGSGMIYTGSGSASAACAYFNPTATYLGSAQGASQALICRYSV